MRKFSLSLVISIFIALNSGCAWFKSQDKSADAPLTQIQKGQDREVVHQILGEPAETIEGEETSSESFYVRKGDLSSKYGIYMEGVKRSVEEGVSEAFEGFGEAFGLTTAQEIYADERVLISIEYDEDNKISSIQEIESVE